MNNLHLHIPQHKDSDEAHSPVPHHLTYKACAVFVIGGLIIGGICQSLVPASEKKPVFMSILGYGLLLGAFVPQLIQNYYLKSKATDPVVAVFLILTTAGVLLRFPALRKQLIQARTSKLNPMIPILGIVGACLPAAAHIIWAWQCVWYNSEKAQHQKDVLMVAAPILSIIIVVAAIWSLSGK